MKTTETPGPIRFELNIILPGEDEPRPLIRVKYDSLDEDNLAVAVAGAKHMSAGVAAQLQTILNGMIDGLDRIIDDRAGEDDGDTEDEA